MMAPTAWLGLVVLAAATWVLMWLNLIVFCIQVFPGSARAVVGLLLLAMTLALWIDTSRRRRQAPM